MFLHFRDLKGTLLLALLGTLVPQACQDCLGMEIQDHKGHQDHLGHQVPHRHMAQVTTNTLLWLKIVNFYKLFRWSYFEWLYQGKELFINKLLKHLTSALLVFLTAASLPGPPGPPGPPGAPGHGNPVSQMSQNSAVGEQAHKGLNAAWFFLFLSGLCLLTYVFVFPGEHI